MSQTEEPAPAEAKRSAEDSEKESSDVFEDAVDTTSVRSLTKRTPSLAKRQTMPETAAAAPKAPIEKADAAQVKPADRDDDVTDDKSSDENDSAVARKVSVASHRLSQTSNLDNVNLDDDSNTPQPPPAENKPSSPTDKEPTKTLSLSSLTSALPSLPWSPPASATAQESPSRSPVAPAPPSSAASATAAASAPRKLTSPFSWLSRSGSKADNKDGQPSPPPQVSPRRNTASSIATLTSNPEMMLGRLEEEREAEVGGVTSRGASLKDRFKMVRMREEAGIVALPEDDAAPGAIAALVGRSNSLGLGIVSPTSTHDKDPMSPDKVTSPVLPTTPSATLAPGTASGVSAGPSAMTDAAVDWDLWQSVVNEGPAAVARTSAEELNKAIATGIPSAIRGVIWQVLAQSKNEDLEVVYKELAARGTEKDKDRHSQSTTASTTSNGTLSISDTVASSASSVHSEQSAPNGVSSPTDDKKVEAALKAQAAAAAEKKRKDKEDTAMLQKLEKTIRRDLGARTSYSKFAASAGLQEGLFGVCKAYALFDEGVGYAQGMNFLVMPLLFNMPEEEAFCLLVRLMNHYKLRDLFIQDMPGLHMHLYQFERLLEDLEPALYCHLHRRGISPHLYATQWFLTLFAYRFPLQLVLRIYDLILSEGLSAILRFGVVLMQKNAATLLSMSDMAQLTTYLKDKLFDVYIDKDPSSGSILENGFFGSAGSSIDKEIYRADQLVRDASEVKLTPETLKAYTAEWEEKTRAEREREAELEGLRAANASYAVRVRKLEDRLGAADAEQATMATELVHTKVENEELKDENESLKGQVRELRVVIEKQPAEIEEAWKLERDDLLKRNGKVHEENLRLEKEMADLEEALVQTKMQYAEINAQHEALSRKWLDMKKQFT